MFAPGFKFLLLRAMAIGRRCPDLKDSTLGQYHGDLERRLDRLLDRPPDTPAARRLFAAMRRDRDDLFRFVTRRDVPYTNNACERALRPSVIFRKVTGCFRSQWGAEGLRRCGLRHRHRMPPWPHRFAGPRQRSRGHPHHAGCLTPA